MNRGDARGAWVLVRTEIRVRLRQLRSDSRKLTATGFTLFLFGVVVPWWVRESVIAFGNDLASGTPPVGTTGAVLTGVALFAGYVGGASGFAQEAGGAVGPLIRTSIPPRAVSLGRLVSEVSRSIAFAVPTVVALVLGVWAGADGPVAPLVLLLAVLPVGLAALVVGRVVGDALRYANAFTGLSLWTRALLFLAVSMLIFFGTQRFLAAEVEGSEGVGAVAPSAFLPGEPLQAYAAVALRPLADPGGTAAQFDAGGALGPLVAGAVLVSIPVGLLVALRVETRLLDREISAETETVEGTRGVPRPFAFGQSTRVAWRYLLRTRRDPRTLAHLLPLLFAGLATMGNVLQDPDFLYSFGPSAAVIGGAVLAGAAYCLNPMGDELDQLPLLLTSTESTAVLLRGRAVAGMALGLVVSLGVGTPLAFVDYSLEFVAWQSVLAVVLASSGAGVALGLGALVPKFERREYMSVERPHPSNYALFGFFFGGIAVGGVGLGLVAVTVGGAPGAAVAAGWTLYLAVVGGAGLGGYVYAVRKFDDFGLDDV